MAGKRLGSLEEIAFDALMDRAISPMGRAALAIRPGDWKHAETSHFIYHYFNSFVATPASVEAEFFYRVVAEELGRETAPWEPKCHIFIFETAEDWEAFKTGAALDPWTGGIHAGGELFFFRDAEAKWKGRTLGHEVVHLVIYRFFGNEIPLWLNEGYAEYASIQGYAAFWRARNYIAKPHSGAVPPERYMPLAELLGSIAYPQEPAAVEIFYAQSERLIRFLVAADKASFIEFFELMSKGARFEGALERAYGTRWRSAHALEEEFREYASKDFGTTLQDRESE